MFILLRRLFQRSRGRHGFLLLGAVAVCVIAGGAAFAFTQHLPLATGLYWSVTTATTVGYGDVTPHDTAGRIVAAAVMLTCIPLLAAAFAVFTAAAASAAFRKALNMATFPTRSYRLVLGGHPAVPAIIDELATAGDTVVLVAEVEPNAVREGVHLVRGDPTQAATLQRAHPERAMHALITGASDGDVLVSAVLLRQAAPELGLTALVRSPKIRDALHDIGVHQTVCMDDLVAHTMAKSLEAPHAGDLLRELIGSERHRLVEVDVTPASVGRPLSALRSERDVLVLGLVREDRVVLGIADDPVAQAGDRLLSAEPLEHREQRARNNLDPGRPRVV